MSDPATPLDAEEAKKHLAELVLEHFGIPRSGRAKDLEILEESLLPIFIQAARHAWITAATVGVLSPRRTAEDPSYRFLESATERHSADVRAAMMGFGQPQLANYFAQREKPK